MRDLKYLVQFFRRERKEGRDRPFHIDTGMLQSRLKGRFWVENQQAGDEAANEPLAKAAVN